MDRRSSRHIILAVIVLTVLAVTSVPLLGRAQQATPVASPVAAVDDAALVARGEEIFTAVCMACHQAGGTGIEGIYPALDGNALVTLDNPEVVTRTVLYGRGGMPRFNWIFGDEDIAAVVSYIRGGLGDNAASAISPDYVAAERLEVEGTPIPVSEDSVGQRAGDPDDQAATPAASPDTGD